MEPESIAVFVPKEWREVNDMSLLELQLKSDMSATHKCHDRPLNPMLFEARIEFMERMCTHLYEDSDNPIVVLLVVALKATAPLYVCVETMCRPTSSQSLDAISFRIFNMNWRDLLDLSSSTRWTLRIHFIKVPLAEHTSNMLSVITP